MIKHLRPENLEHLNHGHWFKRNDGIYCQIVCVSWREGKADKKEYCLLNFYPNELVRELDAGTIIDLIAKMEFDRHCTWIYLGDQYLSGVRISVRMADEAEVK